MTAIDTFKMKTALQKSWKSLFLLIVLAGLGACDEELKKAKLNAEIESNTLTGLTADTYVLTYDAGDEEFGTFEWTAPDFGFEAYVTYSLEVAVAGYEFAETEELANTDELSVTLTNAEVNEALLTLGLTAAEAASVQFRVVSTVDDNVDPVYSSVLDVVITPYATTFPPIYVIGAAQGWDLGQAAALEATGPSEYQGVADLEQDGNFRFFAEASWDAEQWGWSYFEGGTVDASLEDSGDGDSNFLFTGESGTYQITVSLTSKTITIEEATNPTMYVMGDLQGWDLNSALQMKSLGDGVFELVASFSEGDYFRFFETAAWDATQYGYSYFAEGSVGAELQDGGDGDSNFIFGGSDGIYKITISLDAQTITVEAAEEPTLFIIGDDQGWDLGSAFALTWLGGGKFEGTTTFTTDNIFRFFEAADWSATQYNYNYFLDGSIDETHLSGVTEGDANFTFIGDTGAYTITVNLNAPSVIME